MIWRAGDTGARKVLVRYVFIATIVVVGAVAGSACGSSEAPGDVSQRGDADMPDPRQLAQELAVARRELSTTKGRVGRKSELCTRDWIGPQENDAVAAKLLIDRRRVLPGTRIFVRIENLGRAALGYGEAPKIDRLDSGRWHGVSVGSLGMLLELRPRSTSSCLEVPVSDSWRPGLYRMSFEVEEIDNQGGASELSTVYFRVIGSKSRQ